VSGVFVATAAELDAATLYRLLQLRSDVFVLEQECLYRDLDGRDLEPATMHLWTAADDGTVTAYLRVLAEPDDGIRVGRVCTAVGHRGRGLAETLVRRALTLAHGRDVVLDAQAHLEAWYGRLGFVRAGEPFVEDGIPHVPMRRRSP
jgi:ElaA protein